MHMYMCMYTHVHTYLYIHIHIYIYTAGEYIYIHIHTHTHTAGGYAAGIAAPHNAYVNIYSFCAYVNMYDVLYRIYINKYVFIYTYKRLLDVLQA